MSKKKELGQFYTTNYDYIFTGMRLPDCVNSVIEPFVGEGHLVCYAKKCKPGINVIFYDIDPKLDGTIIQDTLLDTPDYTNHYIITNPPYLARNKSKNKVIFDKYKQNDLYKCFISQIINNNTLGGMIIIPLNFISSIRKSDIELRKKFLQKYQIDVLNIFEEQVFNDTSYSVCSLQFSPKTGSEEHIGRITIFPSMNSIDCDLNKNNNYTIGGEIYNLPVNEKIIVQRLTKQNKNSTYKTNILAKCIDDATPIGLSLVSDEECYVDDTKNLSARSYATLVIEPVLQKEKQEQLCEHFNKFIKYYREKYNSLFLTNYREDARKRISFSLIFRIVNYLLSESIDISS